MEIWHSLNSRLQREWRMIAKHSDYLFRVVQTGSRFRDALLEAFFCHFLQRKYDARLKLSGFAGSYTTSHWAVRNFQADSMWQKMLSGYVLTNREFSKLHRLYVFGLVVTCTCSNSWAFATAICCFTWSIISSFWAPVSFPAGKPSMVDNEIAVQGVVKTEETSTVDPPREPRKVRKVRKCRRSIEIEIQHTMSQAKPTQP